jgi:hypothetical protein
MNEEASYRFIRAEPVRLIIYYLLLITSARRASVMVRFVPQHTLQVATSD